MIVKQIKPLVRYSVISAVLGAVSATIGKISVSEGYLSKVVWVIA
jgi:hypothetical protein